MWPQEPGSFTRIIAAIVAPRNTSSETIRPGRGVPLAAKAFDTGAGMGSAVAMVAPSNGRDGTAGKSAPQRRKGPVITKKGSTLISTTLLHSNLRLAFWRSDL